MTRYLNFEFVQLKVLQMAEGCNYIPVKELSIGGIIMVRQAQPNTPEELVEPVAGLNFSLEIKCLETEEFFICSFWTQDRRRQRA
jgi:26S proteasome regulatory subunit RPN2 C-terminal domain